MSARIFGGIIFRGSSLDNAFWTIKYIRKKCMDIELERQRARLYEIAVEILDSRTIGESWSDIIREYNIDPTCTNAILAAKKVLCDTIETIRKDGLFNPHIDTKCSITIHPEGDDVLGIMSCDMPELALAILESEGVGAYPYWDNSDKPAGVSCKDWGLRKQRWHKVIEQETNTGLIAKITNGQYRQDVLPKTLDKLNSFDMPTMDKRVKKFVLQIMSKSSDLTTKRSVKEIMCILGSEDWASRREEAEKHIRAKLPQTYDIELLKRKLISE